MTLDRSAILKPELRVPFQEVRWYFIESFYDAPISGLARFRDRTYRFCCFPEDMPDHVIYVLHALAPDELREALRVKEKFEAMVGTHWSFDSDGKRLPQVQCTANLSRRFFEEEKSQPMPQPGDRPVVAWFDIRPD